ncbi:hypothetical protein H5410_012126 [Solanum commersonii]|uniref:Uncharacterized protein n=1 Tax=Solanum commersonii TaxID=4109 RepID=A0A9J6ARB6_SOLCO|nr:hypothetical protein H5410_012126 [Solanum commersonii]
MRGVTIFSKNHDMELYDIVVENIDQQVAQSNNVGSSSWSHDREMQVQREKIVPTMWEDYIKD